ncbi:hypothetical protein AKO1_014898 [Acrasis kona]|uniref:Uncharacterized protein n=1 Tax=Acrasis kona TaxID=1008807 RepID=A0AAW2Z258_9EUKA
MDDRGTRRLRRRHHSSNMFPDIPHVSHTINDQEFDEHKKDTLKEWLFQILAFFRQHWHLITFISVSGFLAAYQYQRSKKSFFVGKDSVKNVVKHNNIDDIWKVHPSVVTSSNNSMSNTIGVLRTRSFTRIGGDAALQRYQGVVGTIKTIMSIVSYRIPRAIHDWETWFTAAAYGLYYFSRSGGTPTAPIDNNMHVSLRAAAKEWVSQKSRRGREKSRRIGTRLKQIITKPVRNSQIIQELENSFDRLR